MSNIPNSIEATFANYNNMPSGVADVAGDLPATLSDGTKVEEYDPTLAEAGAQKRAQQVHYERAHPIESGVTPQARFFRRLGALAGLAVSVPVAIEAAGTQDGATFAALGAINLAVGIGQEFQFYLEARARERRAGQSDSTPIGLGNSITSQLEATPSIR
ncbi:MAG: hypothetical protein ACM3KF_02925 [Acidobacteriota bacterium]